MGELNTFPVSYKVQGKRIVIIGDGEEALNKARLALKTTASVVLVSSSHVGLDGALVVPSPFMAEMLDNTALVFIAETGPDADAAKAEAHRRGIPVNVVDEPEECDFYTPSIVDRAPRNIDRTS